MRRTIAGALLLMTLPCLAWERDVHYDLTRWLAFKAGFSDANARKIAAADQSLDDSHHAAAVPSVLWAILLLDKVAARDVRDKHFPSEAEVPGPPASRVVTPNSPAARGPVEIAAKATSAPNALERFGSVLHPFQDSWSHQGIPDSPLRPGPVVRSDLTFSHPEKRGGWILHDADLTHCNPDDAIATAKETYAVMRTFLQNNPRFRDHKPTEWNDLAEVLPGFIQADSKDDKATWFANHGMPETRVSTLTLTGVGRAMRVLVAPPPPLRRASRDHIVLAALAADERKPEVPVELITEATRFLRTWFEQRNIPKASEVVEWSLLRAQFAGHPGPLGENDRNATIQWCRKFMTMYLIEDHARVNTFGHCDPTHRAYGELPEEPAADGSLRARERIALPKLTPGAFAKYDDNRFALVLTFDELPHDGIALVWQRVGSRWTIVSMFSLAI